MIMKYNGPKPEAAAIEYDPVVIHDFAKSLYAKANSIEQLHALMGFLIGLIGLPAAGGFIGITGGDPVKLLMLIGAIMGFLIGRSIGRNKGIQFKIQAQQAMCLAQIELNTKTSIAAIEQAAHDAVLQIKLMNQV